MLTKRNFYINGQWVAPAKARDCQVINPSTEEPCAVISLGDQADTDAAENRRAQPLRLLPRQHGRHP